MGFHGGGGFKGSQGRFRESQEESGYSQEVFKGVSGSIRRTLGCFMGSQGRVSGGFMAVV